MKQITRLTVVLYLLLLSDNLRAQNYSRGEQSTILPSQVIIENYTAIQLPKEVEADPNGNRFDKYNVYTYLQLIHDNTGRDYHILFQTSFQGKVLFLAYSNNLVALFNGREKPLNVFINCIKHINEHISPLQNADAAINCMIGRLNYVSN